MIFLLYKQSNIVFLFLLFTLMCKLISAQTNLDSSLQINPTIKILIDSLNKEKDDLTKIRLLNELAWNYTVIDFEKGIELSDSAFALASKLDLSYEKGVALNNIGEALRFKGDISGSIEKHQSALKIFESLEDQNGLADTYRQLGIAYFYISNFSKALENFNDALQIYGSINDKKGLYKISNHMGILYGTLNQNEKALESFNKALNYSEKVGAKAESAIQYGNIALIYDKQKEFTKALKYYAEAIKIFKEVNDHLNYYTNLGNIGLVYINLRNYPKAKSVITEALSIANMLKDEYGVAYQYGSLGNLYFEMVVDSGGTKNIAEKKYLLDQSIFHFKAAVEKFNQLGLLDEQKNYLYQLANSYKEANDYKSALETYTKANELQDSIFSASTKKQIEELIIKQDLIIKEKQVEILSKENQYQEIVRNALIGFLVLVSVMLIFIVFTFLKKRRDNLVLQENIEQREIVEKALRINEAKLKDYQDHLEQLVTERTAKLESEIIVRKHAENELVIAKEKAEKSDRLKSEFLAQMTHEIRTPLSGILGQFAILQNENSGLSDELLSKYTAIKNASSRLIRTIESILKMAELTSDSYKYQITTFELKDVLERVIRDYKSKIVRKGLKLNVNLDSSPSVVQLDRNSVDQIFTNIIDNALTFTEEGEINVRFTKSNSTINVEIEDSGIGIGEDYLPKLFEPFIQEVGGYNRSYEGNGLGLALTKKYCDLNNIDIKITSQKNLGTKVNLFFTSD